MFVFTDSIYTFISSSIRSSTCSLSMDIMAAAEAVLYFSLKLYNIILTDAMYHTSGILMLQSNIPLEPLYDNTHKMPFSKV